MPDFTYGPTRVYVPISVRYKNGFCGGPVGYEERTEGEEVEPIIVDVREEATCKRYLQVRQEASTE